MSNDSDTYNIFSLSDDLVINRKFEFIDSHHTLRSDERWFDMAHDRKKVWIFPNEGP